jgi:hypothetical protein
LIGVGGPFLRAKRPGREADHSSQAGVEVINMWSYKSTPPYFFMSWCVVKHKDVLTFKSVTLVFMPIFPGSNNSGNA